MLYFDSAWRYASPAEIPSEIIEAILTKVIAPAPFDGARQDLLENFKRRFAHAQGQTASRSSSESWAESDLHGYMRGAAANAPLFVEALHDALMDLYGRNPLLGTPPWAHVNGVLAPSGYAIQPPQSRRWPSRVTGASSTDRAISRRRGERACSAIAGRIREPVEQR